MNIHKLARLTPFGREVLVQRVAAGVTVAVVARVAGVSRPTVYKWCRRAEEQTPEALHDRASTPHHSPQRLVRYRRRQIEKRRRQRWSSRRIAQKYDLPISTVVTEIRRLGLNRLASLEPPRPMVRYERERPGELVHLDIKKLGKNWRVGHRIHGNRRTRVHGIGWEYTHVAIDDHSRLSYADVLADETAETTAGFLRRAVAWYAAQGIAVERLLTDNGSAYRSPPLAQVALALGISQRFTQAYRPQTNGKAERFIRTLLTEWAYATAYGRSARRTAALPTYLTYYKSDRRHRALNDAPPASRLPIAV
ncbi:IS481 family transposase [Gemmatimonas sp.]|uniref:IS481 family transposase n=1 Tax=Gemmatimonas sp. TaxID=1962908 RepID=UPI0025BB6643|nr:IS481 family transposase [Gemmatimonas sp.]MCA2992464.1 IS481 family transposase [Gemmatimonas sp.]